MIKLLYAVLLCSPVWAFAQTVTWKADRERSVVRFSVNHLVISKVDGVFKNFEGDMTSKGPDFSDATVSFTVDVFSINTGDAPRDNHLKSNDFFNAEKHPAMTFKSSSLTKVTNGKYLLTGDLTIRDVTKQVKFNVAYGGTTKDATGKQRATFKVNTYLNRFDYHLKWDKLTEAGGMVVDKMVNIELKLEFVQQ
ncbi:polyisoprenoid-binding protein [Chitinophaga lutea]|uniref:Polyisoprenoid-binding protein n=1 Tax=Chitinophaga lutea TaxID=2488634 RepID=A0A3N4PN70_9BACT|nr:YceI family protein [Chitinophaga lutea]RPE09616.1 polyisoprenoid-binding protein [Chitinophaga lutea]